MPTSHPSGWAHADDAASGEPPLCTTFGTILKRTRSKIVVAGTVGHGDGQVGDQNVIPAGMVRKIVPLGEVWLDEAKKKRKSS